MVWYCISNEWRCMAWGGIALHGMARYGVAWNGTGLHCTGCTCMVLHFMSWCDIAWHGLAVLIVHTHCCWVSRFGVLPRRAITLLDHSKFCVTICMSSWYYHPPWLQGNGASWCSGDCTWMNEQCVPGALINTHYFDVLVLLKMLECFWRYSVSCDKSVWSLVKLMHY